jgi:hypothetical protein
VDALDRFAAVMAERCGLDPANIKEAAQGEASSRNPWPDVWYAYQEGARAYLDLAQRESNDCTKECQRVLEGGERCAVYCEVHGDIAKREPSGGGVTDERVRRAVWRYNCSITNAIDAGREDRDNIQNEAMRAALTAALLPTPPEVK